MMGSMVAGLSGVRGIGLYSVLLGGVLVLFLGGLWMADRALTEATRELVQTDAREVAVLLTDAVEHHRQGLQDARAVFAAAAAPAGAEGMQLRRLLPGMIGGGPAIERYWVADVQGRVLLDTVLASGAPRSDVTAEPVVRELVSAARRTGRAQLGVVPAAAGRPRKLVLVEPLAIGDTLRGTAAALFPAAELLGVLARHQPKTREGLLVRLGRDTLATQGRPRAHGDVQAAREPVPMVGGGAWSVEVQHRVGGQMIRRVLWTLSLVAAALLAAGLLRERQQALRVAERSAELERLSSELLRANRMKSEFLANVSHELRTPLNAIVGFVELLRDGVYGELSPRQVQPVERIAASATHLRHLVDQVLDIAKIAAGRLEVHPETIVLRPFVLNVASELESLTSEKGLSLSITVGASLPRVRTDPQHLRQILVNLIGNAVKYTSAGGIVVRARLVSPEGGERQTPEELALRRQVPRPDRPWVALQVSDTGIGIAAEDHERIFDEFEQVNAGPRGDSMNRGTGLGLAISRRLARLLDGEITLESVAGRGSTFTLWLPVSPGETAKAA